MSLAVFIGVAIAGALAGLAVRHWRPASRAIGLGSLVLAFAIAMTIHAGDTVGVAETALVATDFTRLVAILGSATAVLLCLVCLATEWQPAFPPAALGVLAAMTVALAALEPSAGVLAALGAGLIAVLVTAGSPGDGTASAVSLRTLRAIVLAGVLAFVAVLVVNDPIGALAIDPAVLGAAYLVGALAVALRFATVPFHVWAGRLADAAPEMALPIVLAWSPAALAAVVLTWTDSSISPLLAPLDVERAIVVVLGAATILLGAFAAWIQDDVEHVVTYSIAQDAGFVLLALGALDPIAWEPARTWIVVLALGKTAFAAWVVAVRVAFGTRRVSQLAGWASASPLLGLALAGIAIATVGWPGSAAWSARGELIRATVSDPLGILVTVGGLSSLLVYGRLLAVGVAAPSTAVRAGASWLPRRPERVAEATPAVEAAGVSGSAVRRRPAVVDTGGGFRARLATLDSVVSLNRAPMTAGLVLLLVALAVSGAAGGLGLPAAARSAAPVAPDVLQPVESPPSGAESLPPGAESLPPGGARVPEPAATPPATPSASAATPSASTASQAAHAAPQAAPASPTPRPCARRRVPPRRGDLPRQARSSSAKPGQASPSPVKLRKAR